MLCYKTSGYIASKYRSGYKKEYGIATNFFLLLYGLFGCCNKCGAHWRITENEKKKPYMELERGLKEQTYKH